MLKTHCLLLKIAMVFFWTSSTSPYPDTFSLSPSLTLTLSYSHTLSISHSITLDNAEQFLFSCLGSKVAVYCRKLQCFFLTKLLDSSTLSCEFGVHRAGSQLKKSWRLRPLGHYYLLSTMATVECVKRTYVSLINFSHFLKQC